MYPLNPRQLARGNAASRVFCVLRHPLGLRGEGRLSGFFKQAVVDVLKRMKLVF